MPPKIAKLDPAKQEAEFLSAILMDLLRNCEENKYCADCSGKQPRWASWNLGVFLCIRCAGIHRNLGVHISRVKSINLDTWTAEQVQSMRIMGNARAKQIYEATLAENFSRPCTDQSLESFIRQKYESKKYILRDYIPVKANAADLPRKRQDSVVKMQSGEQAKPPPKIAPANNDKISSNPVKNKEPVQDLIDLKDLFGGISSPNNNGSNDHNSAVGKNGGNLHGHEIDAFGDFASAPSVAPLKTQMSDLNNDLFSLNLSGPSSDFKEGVLPSEKKTTSEILSLYNMPTQGRQNFQQASNNYQTSSQPSMIHNQFNSTLNWNASHQVMSPTSQQEQVISPTQMNHRPNQTQGQYDPFAGVPPSSAQQGRQKTVTDDLVDLFG
uniref:Arf-GAP domain-containing protein n=1 Tax=Rhabditophanes sp. KR3021 TaxID=114890 RepID=A0AC35U6D7_9BILA